MKKIRKTSCNEILYMDLQDITNSYAIQYLFTIKKLNDKEKVEEAINKIISINSGFNVYFSKKSYFENINRVNIEEVSDDSNLFDLYVFKNKIDYEKESIKVYHIKNCGKEYLLFQFLHSAMDGKGCLLFIENLFAYLKDRELIKCSNTMTDKEFIKKLDYTKVNYSKLPTLINSHSKIIKEYNPKWKVIELDDYCPGIIAKIACYLKKEFKNHSVRYMIPTDIRRHDRKKNYTGNLTLPIFLEVSDSDNYQSVNGQLLYKIKNKVELNKNNTSYMGYEYYPKGIRKTALKAILKYISRENRFTIGAIISHLGRIDLGEYNNKNLEIEDFVSLPVQQPLGAFSIVIVEYNHKTKIALSYYENQFSSQYIENLMDNLKKYLFNGIYEFNKTQKIFDNNYMQLLTNSINNESTQIVLQDKNEIYTYNELEANIKKYMNYFKMNNILSQDSILLYLNRGFEYISCVVASVFSGIIFIPIDKQIPEERIDMIIKLSKPSLIISDEENGIFNKHKICLVKDMKEFNSNEKIKLNYDENNIVYKIYTSGTTGIPKCVPISNKNLNNYLLWIKDTIKVKNRLVMPLYTSLSVDLTITSTFLPLISGGIIKTYSETFNSNVLKRIVNDPEINVVKATPTHLSFLDKGEKNNIEYLIIGGEQLYAKRCHEILQLLSSKCKIINEYGPTEATVGCVYYIFEKNCNDVVPIGVPIYNTKVLIYDDKVINEPCKRGELLISGDSVFNGYAGGNNCFVTIDNEKYYKSGDIVYFDNKKLYYSERKDSQVKIKGNRVELDEIKNAINSIKEVEDSVVIYNENIYAYIILKREISSKNIKDNLKKKLPNYMIPVEIIFINEFPILPNGKIDSNKLLLLNKKILSQDIKSNDDIFNILLALKADVILDKNKTLFDIGLESFDIISFIQILIKKYIAKEKEEKFVERIFGSINNITISEIEKIIIEFKE